ncbi:uncharacterized protein TRIREDRAFT_58814, partial [Trichoderma reesei QM6a]
EQLRSQINAEDQKCLRHLWSHDPYVEKKRIEDTKGGLLQDSYNWILGNEDFQRWFQDPRRPLLWIRGDPGKGKTMLLCGIVDSLQKLAPSSLVSFFFCQATDQRINNSTAILRSLMFLLIDQQHHLLKHLQERYVRQGKSLFEPPSAWYALSEIMESLLIDLNDSQKPTCLLIDALDECVNEDLPRLLDFIVKMSKKIPYVKWIISSRNWQHIIGKMETLGPDAQLSLELNANSVTTAVEVYIHQKVLQLSENKKYTKEREKKILDHLLVNAEGTFLWVALVCQNLQRVPAWKALEALEATPRGLEPFYRKMVQSISLSDDAEICESILTVATVARRPLTLQELIALAETPGDAFEKEQAACELIGQCGSFLTIRDEVVYFVHQSARDFLSEMLTKREFATGMIEARCHMVRRSIQLLSQSLKRDIYQLSDLSIHVHAVEAPTPEPLAAVGYSCVFWVDHFADLVDGEYNETTGGYANDALVPYIKTFIGTKYLYWLEALSLLRRVPEGVIAMRKLQDISRVWAGQDSEHLIRDAYRFILAAKQTIEYFPLQIHPSALLICPDGSKIRKLALAEERPLFVMKRGIRTSWDSCLQTLELDEDVGSVALSPDGSLMASKSRFGGKLWDMATGTCLKTLWSPHEDLRRLLFSPNSQQVAAITEHNGIAIWDIESRELIMILEGCGYRPCNSSFSPDGSLFASSFHKHILVWDVCSGECFLKLNSHQYVAALSFSSDDKRLMSCSDRGTITVWDAAGNCTSTLTGSWPNKHGAPCISPDISRVAFRDSSERVGIVDTASGQCIKTKTLGRIVLGPRFFPDGRQVVVALSSNEIIIWDIDGDKPLRTLRGHSHSISSIEISHDGSRLVSSLGDGSGIIMVWDTAKGEQVQTFTGHTLEVRHMSFSSDGQLLASASPYHHIRIWDIETGTCRYILEGHSREVSLVKFSPDSCRLASVSTYDGKIIIWDLAAETCIQLECESQWSMPIDFNMDGRALASGVGHGIIKIWDSASGRCMHTLTFHPASDTQCLAF